jgi:hypothetical protein
MLGKVQGLASKRNDLFSVRADPLATFAHCGSIEQPYCDSLKALAGSSQQIILANPTFCRFACLRITPIVDLRWNKALEGDSPGPVELLLTRAGTEQTADWRRFSACMKTIPSARQLRP